MASTSDSNKALEELDDSESSTGEDELEMPNDEIINRIRLLENKVKIMKGCDDSEPSIESEELEVSDDEIRRRISLLEIEVKSLEKEMMGTEDTELSDTDSQDTKDSDTDSQDTEDSDTDFQDTEEDGVIVDSDVQKKRDDARTVPNVQTAETAHRNFRFCSRYVAQVLIIYCSAEILLLSASYLLGNVKYEEYVNKTQKIVDHIFKASLII